MNICMHVLYMYMCIAGDCGSHGLAGGEEGKERETDVLESLPNRVVDQVPSCLHNPLIERKRKKERKSGAVRNGGF